MYGFGTFSCVKDVPRRVLFVRFFRQSKVTSWRDTGSRPGSCMLLRSEFKWCSAGPPMARAGWEWLAGVGRERAKCGKGGRCIKKGAGEVWRTAGPFAQRLGLATNARSSAGCCWSDRGIEEHAVLSRRRPEQHEEAADKFAKEVPDYHWLAARLTAKI